MGDDTDAYEEMNRLLKRVTEAFDPLLGGERRYWGSTVSSTLPWPRDVNGAVFVEYEDEEEDIHTYGEMVSRLRKRLGVWSERLPEGELRVHLEMALDYINVGMESSLFDPPFPEKREKGFYYSYEEDEEGWLDLLLWAATGHGVVILEYYSKDEEEIAALRLFKETIDRAEERAWDAFFDEGDDDDPDGDGEPIPEEWAA